MADAEKGFMPSEREGAGRTFEHVAAGRGMTLCGFPGRAVATVNAIARPETVSCGWIHSEAHPCAKPFGFAFLPRPNELWLYLTVSAVGRSAGLVRQPEASQCHAGEAEAELLECPTAGDRLGHLFG